MGVRTASMITQAAIGVMPDGRIGPKTLHKLNSIDSHKFIQTFVIAKIARYAEICNRDRSQCRFLLGWINRSLGGI